jgi:hypothetical protein
VTRLSQAFLFSKTSGLELVELCFHLGFCENGSGACWVAEGGLGCWDFAYTDCFGTVF